MRTIALYGSMAEEFGPSFRLSVNSLGEAVRALSTQLPKFRRYVEQGVFRVVCGPSRASGRPMGGDEIRSELPPGADIHVVPVVRGRGSGSGRGIGKVIVGALLIAGSFATGNFALAGFGASLLLGGASALLSPKKKDTSRDGNKRSYMFNGGFNNQPEQGACVPLPVGRCMVNLTNISAGVTTGASSGTPSLGGGPFGG